MTGFIKHDRTAWWNAEGRKARLVALREAGVAFEKIAAELGTTKNAAVGMANRMGFCVPRPVKHASVMLPDSSSSELLSLSNPRLSPSRHRATDNRSLALPNGGVPPDRGSCVWPLWGNEPRPVYRYCCKRVAVVGAPYCRDHMVVAHQRVRAE